MLKSAALLGLEKTVNFVLARDEASAARLAELEDRLIRLEITDLSLNAYWLFEQQRVRIMPDWRGDVDAHISGSLNAITRMGISKAKVAKGLTVSGDMHVVEAFKELFAKLDIDWEAQIAPFTGDALAFKLGKTVKQASQWLQHAAQQFRVNTKDYLEEEINFLPSKLRLTDFSNDVRELNRDVDRIAARIKRLQSSN